MHCCAEMENYVQENELPIIFIAKFREYDIRTAVHLFSRSGIARGVALSFRKAFAMNGLTQLKIWDWNPMMTIFPVSIFRKSGINK